MVVLNFAEELRVTETGNRLSTDTDCNGKRAAAAGQRIMKMIVFLLCEDSEWKETSLATDSFTISPVRHANFLS